MIRPPFEISHETLRRVAGVGRSESLHSPWPLLRLRRSHRVRTIHDSLAIDGNTLTLEQATTVLEGKRVAAPARDILELQNANAAYEALPDSSPYRLKDLLAGPSAPAISRGFRVCPDGVADPRTTRRLLWGARRL